MAEVKLNAVSLPSMSVYSSGRSYYASDVIKDMTNTPVDLSGWTAFSMKIFGSQVNGNFPAVPIATYSTGVSGTNGGVLELTIDPTVVVDVPQGSAVNVAIYGKNGIGDPEELLGFGTIKAPQY